MCYTPKFLWDAFEGGLMRTIVMGLNMGICEAKQKEEKKDLLIGYLMRYEKVGHYSMHSSVAGQPLDRRDLLIVTTGGKPISSGQRDGPNKRCKVNYPFSRCLGEFERSRVVCSVRTKSVRFSEPSARSKNHVSHTQLKSIRLHKETHRVHCVQIGEATAAAGCDDARSWRGRGARAGALCLAPLPLGLISETFPGAGSEYVPFGAYRTRELCVFARTQSEGVTSISCALRILNSPKPISYNINVLRDEWKEGVPKCLVARVERSSSTRGCTAHHAVIYLVVGRLLPGGLM
ncbi:Innexin inx1 [Eumeta japonica]|uniref:Innexin inx1 n=1 Tax=Eumeta variegata TaxID=151549 RepID=A0A4C1TT88_EUMVA|nr:Innexin inx1 [Eumeta japonica]